ncbi:MAG TPA: choline dehydrogenase [Xanthobacteraceae bacterium]|nr:choline dehydrogenase [Xanthobacteraceae bacterium]
MGSFDYIVVGAGSAGCVLANRLSADPSVKVLLLEAGGKDNNIWIKIPLGLMYVIGNPRTDWCYETEPEPECNGRRIPIPRGKTLGGSSSINGMVYVRGQPQDYDVWRQLGNAGWSWGDVLPYFKKSEDYIHGADELHGAGGELRVEEARVDWEVLDAFRDACEQVGIPKTKDYNSGNYEGSAYFQVTQKRGVRWSTASAFLRPAMNRPNLRVITGAQTARLQIDARRAVGVEFWHDGVLRSAQAGADVVLSAGAIGSPQILQASGIGPAALLREHDIDVRLDVPGVGENLQDHCQPRQMFRVHDTKTLNEKANSLFGRIGMGLEYMLFRRGPLAIGPATLTVFTKSDPTQETPNIQYHVVPATYPKLGEPPSPFPGFTASACNLRPTSRGYVRIKGADARDNPSIRYNYLATPDDQRVAVDSIRLTRRIVAAPALARFGAEEFLPGLAAQSDAEVLEAAREVAGTVYHPVGTCKMGQDRMAVVDERLRVRGIAGLRVVDASIMPNLVSGNTNAPTIMIAEKAADMMKADRAAPQRVAA